MFLVLVSLGYLGHYTFRMIIPCQPKVRTKRSRLLHYENLMCPSTTSRFYDLSAVRVKFFALILKTTLDASKIFYNLETSLFSIFIP